MLMFEYAKKGTVYIRPEHVTSLRTYIDKRHPGVIVYMVGGASHVVKGDIDHVAARIEAG